MVRALFTSVFIVMLSAGAVWGQTNYNTSPPAQTGEQVFGSYFASDIDNVGLYNGNLNLHIGLIQLPGRELSTSVNFTYNSQKWEQELCDDGLGNYWSCGMYSGGWQVMPAVGRTSWFGVGQTMNLYWIDANGTKHVYPLVNVYQPNGWDNQTVPSMDSDGSVLFTGTYWSDRTIPAYIAFKDGSRRYLSDGTVKDELMTANGNYVAYAQPYSIVPMNDTLNRTIQYQSGNSGYYIPFADTYKALDANNVLQPYTVNYSFYTVYDPWWQGSVTQRNISSIVLPNGKSYLFEYQHAQGFLTKVTLPSGAYIRYVYPASPYNTQPGYDQILQRIVSSDGTSGSEKIWAYSGYTGLGTSVSARTVTVTSPESDKIVHTLNAQGLETQTQWQTVGNAVLKTVATSWSNGTASNGQPVSPKVSTVTTTLDSGAQSTQTRTYDSNMNLTQEKVTDWSVSGTGPIVSQKDIAYTTITAPNVSNFTRPSSETLTAIDPVTGNFVQQGRTDYAYDQYGFLHTYTSGVPNSTGNSSSSNLGNLTTVTHYKDASNFVAEHMYYDNLGNVVKKVDGLGSATTIDYTDNFCALPPSSCSTTLTGTSTYAYATQVTNQLGQSATTRYDINTGLAKQVTNLRGLITTTSYDLLSRVTSVTEPNGKQTTYYYDDPAHYTESNPNGNPVTTSEVTVGSGNKTHLETYFDKLYRVTRTRTNDPEGPIAADMVYDGKGRKTQITNPYRVGGTQIWTTTTYDALDRPVAHVQTSDSSTVQYAYSNNQTTVTDEAANPRRYTYNVLGQMTMVEEPKPTLATALKTTYSYYGFGPLYQSNQSGQMRTFVNNWLGQMTSQNFPESGTTTFAYDAAGRLTSKTDARSMSVIYCYDSVNRQTMKMYSGSCATPGNGLVTLGYDASGQTGFKTSMTDAVGSVTYTFDSSMNRLTQESRTLSGVSGTFTTAYAYNLKGDLTSMTYPSGRIVNFSYNVDNNHFSNSRLSSVFDQTTSTTVNSLMTYTAPGGLSSSTFGNSIVQTLGYNDRLQETSITATAGGTTLMNFSYNYGAGTTNTGRVLSRTDAIQPEHSANYYYDSIYRLDGVGAANTTASWGISWTFDVWGNRRSQTPQGLGLGSPLSSYTNNRNDAFSYDFAGNQLYDGVHHYTFNAENQITQMDGGVMIGGVTYDNYVYDGEGHRMKKVTSSETTYTFYGPGGIISEFTTSPAIATATAAASTDKTFYHTTDKLGSAVLVMNSAGVVIENNRTLPYGEAWLTESTPSTNDKKLTTYPRDQESGLDYAMNRFDSSSSGRFMSADQGELILFKPITLNRYLYVSNDPINFVDSTGRETECPPDTICVNVTAPLPPSPTGPTCPYPGVVTGGICIININTNTQMGPGIPVIPAPVQPSLTAELRAKLTKSLMYATETVDFWGLRTIFGAVKAVVRGSPVAGSVMLPLGEELAGLNFNIPFAYNYKDNSWCVGGGIALGDKSFNFGPMLLGNLDQSKEILKAWGWSVTIQATQTIGVQGNVNSSGTLVGSSIGTPGMSVAYSYSICTGN